MVPNLSVAEDVRKAVKKLLQSQKRRQYLAAAVVDQKHRRTMKLDLIKTILFDYKERIVCNKEVKEFKLTLTKTLDYNYVSE